MPIVLAFILLAAIVYGAVALYMTVATDFGWLAGVGADLLAVALIAALIAAFVYRYRLIHGKTVKGKRILSLKGPWGEIHVDANEKRGSLTVNGREAQFIFADIADVQAFAHGAGWTLALHLEHNRQTEWEIPMKDRRQARRWAKVLALAAEQNL